MALPKKIEPGDDKPKPATPPTPATEYVTRAEFEAAMRKLRSDLKTSISEALRDMRDMLKQSLEAHAKTQEAHKQALELNEQQRMNFRTSLDASSQQRDMILETLRGVRDTNREMMGARAAELKAMQIDLDDLQGSNTNNQVAIATLIEKHTQMTGSVDNFVRASEARDVTATKRMTQMETRIEENRSWIERRALVEKRVAAALRPALKLPRAVKLAALVSIAATGTQLEFDWLHWLMELIS